ncbi:MAG: imidazole glycerol phosphate synthase subunit HisH [Deltaproteobacteria bacterium]|nr:imidazole glycerol phosphate synthase subunit HisH [Deltaproteobacteria bacterium]MBI4196501.1 imidazole glycerol phosphate synthase subunit HisH [Deltaproteobacteria bacterium]
MITIIDPEMGNLRSVQKAFEKAGTRALITSDPKKIVEASKVVLPGVGAFGEGMKNLKKLKLIDPILKAIEDKKPFLGICLGFQILFEESEEFGHHKGLGVLKGRVAALQPTSKHKVPHMGWNRIKKLKRIPLLGDVPDGSYFYFVHSYYVIPKEESIVITETDYIKDFCSSVARDNLFACQFHPEKSQTTGLKIIKAFAEGKSSTPIS